MELKAGIDSCPLHGRNVDTVECRTCKRYYEYLRYGGGEPCDYYDGFAGGGVIRCTFGVTDQRQTGEVLLLQEVVRDGS